jgi:hypothetical protein
MIRVSDATYKVAPSDSERCGAELENIQAFVNPMKQNDLLIKNI